MVDDMGFSIRLAVCGAPIWPNAFGACRAKGHTPELKGALCTSWCMKDMPFALAQEPKLWSLVLQAFAAIKRVSSRGAQRSP